MEHYSAPVSKNAKNYCVNKKLGEGFNFPTIFLFCIASSFIIYFPVLNRYFVSDDFKVLNRVCRQNKIFIQSFFRPLSDITIRTNYLIGGLNPLIFNSFNILVNGINAFLVYLLAFSAGEKLQLTITKNFASISAVFFLCYPFHNEAVVWLLGRGASMACLFTLISFIAYFRMKHGMWRKIVVCVSWFIALSAFESTILFPLQFTMILVFAKETPRVIRSWLLCLAFTLTAHLLIRFMISGSVLGSYGQGFFSLGIKAYFLNIMKVAGRLILPPLENPYLPSLIFLFLLGFILIVIYKTRHQINNTLTGGVIIDMLYLLVVACILPAFSGVSTQTSETDRMLYYPSVFVSLILGMTLATGIKKGISQRFILIAILGYSLFYLEKNNLQWVQASSITHAIVEKMIEKKREGNNGKIYFLNIPNEIQGAYVFRLGFSDALKLYDLDSNLNIAANYLPRQDLIKMKIKIQIHSENEVIHLPPDILLVRDSSGCRKIFDHKILKYTCNPSDRIYFWNMNQLEQVPACGFKAPT